MKKMILVAAVLALAGAQVQKARAGDCGWTTAGKVLTGVALGAAVVSVATAPAGYSAGYVSYSGPGVSFGYGYNSAPVMCAPAPVVYASRPVVACAPAPVVVYCPPVVYAPVVVAAPVVPVRYGYGYGHRHGHGPHGRW